MKREEFLMICNIIYKSDFNLLNYLESFYLDEKERMYEARAIIKKINRKIDEKMKEWDEAEDKEKVESSLVRDPNLCKVTQKEIDKEKST